APGGSRAGSVATIQAGYRGFAYPACARRKGDLQSPGEILATAPSPHGRGWACAVDRLRKRCEPAALPSRGKGEGDLRPHSDRREPQSADSSDVDRKSVARWT